MVAPPIDDPGWGEYNGIMWHDDGWVWFSDRDHPFRVFDGFWGQGIELTRQHNQWWTLRFNGCWERWLWGEPTDFIEHVMKPNGWEVV